MTVVGSFDPGESPTRRACRACGSPSQSGVGGRANRPGPWRASWCVRVRRGRGCSACTGCRPCSPASGSGAAVRRPAGSSGRRPWSGRRPGSAGQERRGRTRRACRACRRPTSRAPHVRCCRGRAGPNSPRATPPRPASARRGRTYGRSRSHRASSSAGVRRRHPIRARRSGVRLRPGRSSDRAAVLRERAIRRTRPIPNRARDRAPSRGRDRCRRSPEPLMPNRRSSRERRLPRGDGSGPCPVVGSPDGLASW